MKKCAATVLLGLVCLLTSSVAHSQVTTGTISGTVTDSSGGVLPGVNLAIQNENTGISRTLQSDAAGRYAAPSLSLGNYRITASLGGFENEVRTGIALTVGREAVVDLKLTVGAVTQTIEIVEEAPLVQTTESTVSYLVSDRTIRDLPLNGRDLTQLVLMEPGVTQSQNSNNKTSFDGFGKRVSISGLRGEDNAYLLDGSYVNDFHRHLPSGPSGSLLGAETIREFQVLTNSFGAQYGRVLGGVFNAVSKSGTNEWHGDVYEFVRNSSLDAAQWEDNAFNGGQKAPFSRNQFGATTGGPIKKDKAFFFLAYEGTRESLTTTKVANVPDVNARQGILPIPGAITAANCAAPSAGGTVSADGNTCSFPVSSKIKPYLPFFPLPSPQGKNFNDGTAQYVYPAIQPTNEDFGLARVDYQISSADSLFSRFAGSYSVRSQAQGYPVFQNILFMGTRLFTISETHIISPRALNTFRFSFNRVFPGDAGVYPDFPPELLSVPGQAPPGLNPGSGITGFEGAAKPLDYFITNRFNEQDDINLTLGPHSLQFGGMLERLRLNENQPNRPFGEWSFASLTSFLAATPNRYRGTPPGFGTPFVGMRQWFMALYVQDDWRVTPKLTLNLGLRWEPYTVPNEVNGLVANLRHINDPQTTTGDPLWRNMSWKNFGPRFGFAWSPLASGKTSVRGGFGLFYAPNDANVYFIQVTRVTPTLPEFDLPVSGQGHFPDALAEIAAAQLTTFGNSNGFNYDHFKSPHALQYNVSIQQQIGASNVLTVGYTGSRGINLLSKGDQNSPAAVYNGTSLEFPANAALANPKFTGIICYCSDANSWYNGLTASLQRKFSQGLQAQVAYTFSKNLDDDPGNELQGNRRYAVDPRVNKSLSAYNLSQVFSANYSYELPFGKGRSGATGHLLSGWQMSGVVTAQAGQPFSVTASVPSALSALQLGGRTPNQVPGVPYSKIVLGGPDLYFDPQAYSLPAAREIGNVGRNTLIGPGLGKWDVGITKNTALTERFRFQFRGEIFNVLNRANFSVPASSIFNGSGGRVGSAGTITSTIAPSRQIQFGMKLLF